MSFISVSEILRYIDLFGTHFNFYTDRKRKFYIKLGGMLTLLSIIVSILVFIFINFDEFLHNNPISTTSTSKAPERNIKFIEEKIWIPWRIRDYRSRTLNITDVFYPIIYYYHAVKNKTNNVLDLSYDILNYRLCNETSMVNNTNSYILDIELDKLYCIDMDDINMGGNWDNEYINYVQLDLYICKNGIDYDENNKNCSSYEKIIEKAGKDNSFAFDIYYPVVHYQPLNKTDPIFVRYDNYFYHLSRFSNKIDRIYLQKYILKDDTGWLIKNEKTISNWGYISLNGDSYANGDKRDLMNEGSSSRLYSFKIYIKSDVIYYNRYYKKLFLILANGLPIINVIVSFFKIIAKIFKISSGNKKLTELLFENLQKKPKNLSDKKINHLKISQNKSLSDKRINLLKKKDRNINNNNKTVKKNNPNELSSVQLISSKEIGQKNEKRNDSLGSKNESIYIQNIFMNSSKYNNNLNNKYNINYENTLNNNNININAHAHHKNSILLSSKQNNRISYGNIQIKENNKKQINLNNNDKNNDKHSMKNQYITKKLFPYKYYLCSIFIKNIDVTKNSIFFTKKFIVIYNFICQLFDISSYLILLREFQILKTTFMAGKYKEVLENREKINVNDQTFNIDMKECLDSHKLSILGRIKHGK